MKNGVLFFLLSAYAISAFSQEEEVETRVGYHYIGVQANQLLTQLLNFGGSATSASNPYLITYAVNSAKSGVGMNFGFGYSSSQVSSGDPISPVETTTHNLSLRIGMEKKFTLGKRWFSSYGLDFLLDDSDNKTESSFNQGPGFPPIKTTTETSSKGSGLGPRLTLNFLISNKIVLGTEASYYYKSFTQTTKVTNQPELTRKPSSFSFVLPAVIYIIVKI